MAHTGVRAFREDDRAALLALFGIAGEGAPTASLWGDPASEAEVYLLPYLDHEPGSVLVAHSDDDLVGYLVGSSGLGTLPGEDERLLRTVRRHRLLLRPRTMPFFARAAADAMRVTVQRGPRSGELDDPRWPAHLHIDMAPRARGTGLAQLLIGAFTEALAADGVPGVHLQTLLENPRAVRFFAGQGFRRHGPTPRVPGLRYEGRPVHQLTMVRDLPASARLER